MSTISIAEHLSALIKVEVQARDKERERIIKLLEARLLTNPQPNMENDRLGSFSHAMHNQMIKNMVALIKRENE